MDIAQESKEDSPMPPVVREHLLNVGWNNDDYPTQLLELRSSEQHVLEQTGAGLSLGEIARQGRLSHSKTIALHRAALGKQEAMGARGQHVLALSPAARHVIALNGLFGAGWNKANVTIINSRLEVVLNNARELSGLLGEKWKRYPQLSTIAIATIKERIERYDTSLSPSWRSSLSLLTFAPDTVEQKAELYDRWFGEDWRVKPLILTSDPRTIMSSARALGTIGITQGNTPSSSYFGLLSTTVANKRKKVASIRRSILAHQQVYSFEAKTPISEVVNSRKGQTPAEKELEKRELKELEDFIRRLGASGLIRSIAEIESWAQHRGYPVAGARSTNPANSPPRRCVLRAPNCRGCFCRAVVPGT